MPSHCAGTWPWWDQTNVASVPYQLHLSTHWQLSPLHIFILNILTIVIFPCSLLTPFANTAHDVPNWNCIVSQYHFHWFSLLTHSSWWCLITYTFSYCITTYVTYARISLYIVKLNTIFEKKRKPHSRKVRVTAVSRKSPLPLTRKGNNQMVDNEIWSSHMQRMWRWLRIWLFRRTSCWVPTCLRAIKLGKENSGTKLAVNSVGIEPPSEEHVKKRYQDIKGNIKKKMAL